MHDLPLISTLAAAFTAAWLLGLLAQWLRLSPIVGYLLAGILIGPHTPGFVGDVHVAQQLAEIGVILLMFGVGLHFHLGDLLAVRRIAIPGAVGQSLVATLAAMVVFAALGMPLKTGAVLGMAMAVASTVVLMRVLMDADALRTPQGHVAVGWLIVEDIFTVILLVLIPVLGMAPAGGTATGASVGFWPALGLALLKLIILVAIVFWAGSRIIPRVLVQVARLRSRELFTLTVLVFSVAVAAAAYFFFGASMALGAFLAGMVVAQSPVSHQAAADALPMRDAFAVIFFVSVGMLVDPAFIIREPFMVLGALGIILIAKPLAALLFVALLGHSVRTGLTVAVGLAQIGEFSFILSDLARRFGLLPDAGHHVLVTAAILSITINPLLFRAVPGMERWLRTRPRLWRLLNRRAERNMANNAGTLDLNQPQPARRPHAIIAGYGPAGRSVQQVLLDSGVPTVVVDLNMETISQLRSAGQSAIFGDASNQSILEQAGVANASHLVVTVPDASVRAAIVAAGRSFSQHLRIVVRAHFLKERDDLERGGANMAVFDEAEAALALARAVLVDTGTHHEAAEGKLRDIRLQLLVDNVANIRTQQVANVMVPWPRVRTLCTADDHPAVLARISKQRFSRWPVVNAQGHPVGYLLSKDLIAYSGGNAWPELVRPLLTIAPEATIAATLERMQAESATIYLVTHGQTSLGILTMEDILEQLVGRLDDEQHREPPTTINAALDRGSIHPTLTSTTRGEAIRELANSVPATSLPPNLTHDSLVALIEAREQEITTDLGNGIALPHARIPNLQHPVIVAGRSTHGIHHSPNAGQPVQLFFLILTPAEQPNIQLTLLAQLARLLGNPSLRRSLIEADSPVTFTATLHQLSK